MEVSSHALEQGRVDNLTMTGAVFTNLTRDHLDYHGSMDAYGAAKARLFHREELHFAVINFDDPFGRQLYEKLDGKCDRVRYSLHEAQTELWLTEFAPSIDGFSASVDGLWGRFDVSARVLGSFNVSNILAAMAAVLSLGVPVERVQQAVERLSPPPGRLEPFAGSNDVRVVVDYAHTPDALNSALAALRPHVGGRLFCVFGCGGDRDTGKRPEMAREAEKGADVVIVTDDNPRSEDPDAITADIVAGFERPEQVAVIHDRAEAIQPAIRSAVAGRPCSDCRKGPRGLPGSGWPEAAIQRCRAGSPHLETQWGCGMMRAFSLAEAKSWLGAECRWGDLASVSFTGVSTDTRTLEQGQLFVALRGENFDGHRFLQQALDKGAVGLVVDTSDSSVELPQLVVGDTLEALARLAAANREAEHRALCGDHR